MSCWTGLLARIEHLTMIKTDPLNFGPAQSSVQQNYPLNSQKMTNLTPKSSLPVHITT